ncbi:alpha/beta hydrolase [Nitrosospira lacus]|uniref:alpha/beta hydrolase n=1 Tax=Nitrosospira lacus TaxID=1288494 RepID=UPI0005946D63|nr:alpha/beta family hydrolase [Nitrosospira lacus]
MSNSRPKRFFVDGPAGKLETVLAEPDIDHPRGIAVIAHPHPLYGGTMNNKVVYTLFKALLELGFIAVKFNFRGVEQSEGNRYSGNGDGTGEIQDVLAVVETTRNQSTSPFNGSAPLVLAGFSFGGAIQGYAAQQLRPQKLIMVAPSVERLKVPPLARPGAQHDNESIRDILIIQGDQDDVVPLHTVLDWAAPQELPVVVIPGAEHFFHGRLHILKRVVQDSCRP